MASHSIHLADSAAGLERRIGFLSWSVNSFGYKYLLNDLNVNFKKHLTSALGIILVQHTSFTRLHSALPAQCGAARTHPSHL